MDTREKILETALTLFSEKGFHAVGIREIAKLSEVNIASVNYHFQNKENLYRVVIERCFMHSSEFLSELYAKDENISVESFIQNLFHFLKENSHYLKTTFKIMILDQQPFLNLKEKTDDDFIGPPGGKIIFTLIKKHYLDVSDSDAIWAVRTIFTQTIYKALLSVSDLVHKKCLHNGMKIQELEDDLLRLVRVVLKEINGKVAP